MDTNVNTAANILPMRFPDPSGLLIVQIIKAAKSIAKKMVRKRAILHSFNHYLIIKIVTEMFVLTNFQLYCVQHGVIRCHLVIQRQAHARRRHLTRIIVRVKYGV